jgi:hypothetical protein
MIGISTVVLIVLALIMLVIIYPMKVRQRLEVGFRRNLGDGVTVLLVIILMVLLLQFAA